MSTADSSGGTGYVVTSQVPTSQMFKGANTRGMLVTIQTANGHTGELFVPAADYTVDKVKPQLADLAATLTAIANP